MFNSELLTNSFWQNNRSDPGANATNMVVPPSYETASGAALKNSLNLAAAGFYASAADTSSFMTPTQIDLHHHHHGVIGPDMRLNHHHHHHQLADYHHHHHHHPNPFDHVTHQLTSTMNVNVSMNFNASAAAAAAAASQLAAAATHNQNPAAFANRSNYAIGGSSTSSTASSSTANQLNDDHVVNATTSQQQQTTSASTSPQLPGQQRAPTTQSSSFYHTIGHHADNFQPTKSYYHHNPMFTLPTPLAAAFGATGAYNYKKEIYTEFLPDSDKR
jgi:hypothetical protein